MKEKFIVDYANENGISNWGDFNDYKEVIDWLITINGVDDTIKDDIYNVDYWYSYLKEVE